MHTALAVVCAVAGLVGSLALVGFALITLGFSGEAHRRRWTPLHRFFNTAALLLASIGGMGPTCSAAGRCREAEEETAGASKGVRGAGVGGRAPPWGTLLPWPLLLEESGWELLLVAAPASTPRLLGWPLRRGPLCRAGGQSQVFQNGAHPHRGASRTPTPGACLHTRHRRRRPTSFFRNSSPDPVVTVCG